MVEFAPKWAKEAARIGLEMQLTSMEFEAGLIDKDELCRRIGVKRAELSMFGGGP